MLYYSRPVYIGIAVDVGPKLISAESLKTPLVTELEPNNGPLEEKIVNEIADGMRKCKRAVIIVDGCRLTRCFIANDS